MNKTARFAAAGFGLAALIGGAGTGVVMAQSSGGATATTTTTQALADQVAANGAAFITDLAKNLGVSETQLRDALKKTSLDGLDKAVADGKITADEAAKIRTRIESGDGPLFGIGGPRGGQDGPGGHGGGGHGGPGHLVEPQALAAFLGITEGQLKTDMQGGTTTLAAEAAAHGKSRDQLKTFLTDQNNTRIDKGVTDGRLTADQAATMKADFIKNLDSIIDGTGRPMGPGGPNGGPRGNHPATSGTTAPTGTN